MSETVEHKALRWAATGKRGISSNAIFGVMTGNPPKGGYCYPHDAGDLGRCIGLLDAVPEWRQRMDEMKAVGPEWAALVEHWDELAALHAKDSRLVYARMQEILAPIEAKRRGLVRLGPGVSVYFGDSK